jgi:hypothetical protein
MTLVEALKKFNRKERYWLIRNALGEKSGKLDLDPEFCNSLQERLSITVPKDAWWAMDYHLDWLVAALHLFNCKGERKAYKKQRNPILELVKITKEKITNKLVEVAISLVNGTQEDADFIVAFDNTLIFIEAKGDAGWDYEQLSSKIGRLQGIEKEMHFNGLTSYFLLMAPIALQEEFLVAELDAKMKRIHATRPNWVFDGVNPRWLDLHILDEHDKEVNNFDNFHRVERCDRNNDDPRIKGEYLSWEIKPPKYHT